MLFDHHTDRVDKIRKISSLRTQFLEIEHLIGRYQDRCFTKTKEDNMYELDLIQIKMIISRTAMKRKEELEDPNYLQKRNEKM